MRLDEFEDKARSIARAFVDARLAARGLPEFPGAIPVDLAQAYAVQDFAIGLRGGLIGGWKVGRINPPFSEQFGVNRLSGPIFLDSIVDSQLNPVPIMPVFADGFIAAEAELLLRIGPDMPEKPGCVGLDDARAVVDAVRVGIEIASSPFPPINDLGPLVTISDFGNNNGLLLGPEIPDWRTRDLINMPVSLLIDGDEAGRATMAKMLDGPFGSLCFLAKTLADRGFSLEPGMWVSAGAITGVHQVSPGQFVTARFGDSLSVECQVGPAEPQGQN